MSRTTITVSEDLKRRLAALKGEKTWDEFLSELVEEALERRIEAVEAFLRETSDRRDLSFERVRLRLMDDEAGDDRHRRPH